jgi:hypothetical protein
MKASRATTDAAKRALFDAAAASAPAAAVILDTKICSRSGAMRSAGDTDVVATCADCCEIDEAIALETALHGLLEKEGQMVGGGVDDLGVCVGDCSTLPLADAASDDTYDDAHCESLSLL